MRYTLARLTILSLSVTLVLASHPDDDLFLITFNDRVILAEDFTTSGDRILDHLRFATPTGSTALYDGTYLALEKVRQGRHPKKAILIISDGEDNKSRYSGRELKNRAKESDAMIYSIGFTDVLSKESGAAQHGRLVLTEITRTTGGRAFFPNSYNEEGLVEIRALIALELRKQYSIGFYPTDSSRDGKWHKLQIKVKPPKGVGRLYITNKDGYRTQKQ
jgi:Ca-activated chloride channel homolog